jgi:hypothetical protein
MRLSVFHPDAEFLFTKLTGSPYFVDERAIFSLVIKHVGSFSSEAEITTNAIPESFSQILLLDFAISLSFSEIEDPISWESSRGEIQALYEHGTKIWSNNCLTFCTKGSPSEITSFHENIKKTFSAEKLSLRKSWISCDAN